MNTRTKYLIPAFAAVFAVTFAMAAPYVMADDGLGGHPNWGGKPHRGPFALTVEGFTGAIQVPDDINRDVMKNLKDQISVSLVDAATTAQNSGVTDVVKANIGIIQNENGDKFVAWILSGITVEDENVTRTLFVVDAGNSGNTAQVENQFDPTMIKEKFSEHHPFKGNFANLDEATKAEIQSAFQNLRDAKQSGDQQQLDQAKQALKSLFDSIKAEN